MSNDPATKRTREWTHALGVFARCSGIDWAILMTIAQATWANGLDQGQVGHAAFRKRITVSPAALQRCLRNLCAPEHAGGLNLVEIINDSTPRNAKVYRINDDWRTWAWGFGDLSDGKLRLERLYPSTSASHPQTIPVDPLAVQLAQQLREHIRRTLPDYDVPNPDNPGDVRWIRWCGAMERILVRYSLSRTSDLIHYATRHPQWSELLRSPNADKRLEAKIDLLAADYAKQPRPNTARSPK